MATDLADSWARPSASTFLSHPAVVAGILPRSLRSSSWVSSVRVSSAGSGHHRLRRGDRLEHVAETFIVATGLGADCLPLGHSTVQRNESVLLAAGILGATVSRTYLSPFRADQGRIVTRDPRSSGVSIGLSCWTSRSPWAWPAS